MGILLKNWLKSKNKYGFVDKGTGGNAASPNFEPPKLADEGYNRLKDVDANVEDVDPDSPLMARDRLRAIGEGQQAGASAARDYMLRTGQGTGTAGGESQASYLQTLGTIAGTAEADARTRAEAERLTGLAERNVGREIGLASELAGQDISRYTSTLAGSELEMRERELSMAENDNEWKKKMAELQLQIDAGNARAATGTGTESYDYFSKFLDKIGAKKERGRRFTTGTFGYRADGRF